MSSSAVPIYQSFNTSHLPPTPACSSIEKAQVRDLSTVQGSSSHYGSLSTTSAPYFETLKEARPATPSQTTISSNNHDESLYLLWTQALLRERGFTDEKKEDEDEDETKDDDDSSVSDMSSVSSEEEEEDKINIDHYIAEKRKLFSPAPSSLHAYSHRASMVSHYSSVASQSPALTTTAMVGEEDTPMIESSPRSIISSFFRTCFSSCL
ncbi:uncharacterized protein EV154DRAFT_607314 [Mucor mucedo]|uniref:uncharacterized protein n=1 Tax=Mucor mucedo TaxID=29922 RepID=UPI00221F9963|nr:uncharacterized protein EV154DRAFT_607314 [Mucor mucedo]KAI7873182.1 hypothetical protein EV154DRAFT_607314 [Mucor mucedo]